MSGIFPKWMNFLPTAGLLAGLIGLPAVVVGGWYWLTPDFYEVGYEPIQPGNGFNHQIHAGKLGMDCRYCHTNVDRSPEANIPNVSTCMNCHAPGRVSKEIVPDAKVQFIRDAYEADKSIEWRRVHKLPDYVRNFPHHVHINAGVSCFSCHGQVESMVEVHQVKGLGMGWCLDCHRKPEAHLVPKDKVTDLLWVEDELKARAHGQGTINADELVAMLRNNPPQTCGACHQ